MLQLCCEASRDAAKQQTKGRIKGHVRGKTAAKFSPALAPIWPKMMMIKRCCKNARCAKKNNTPRISLKGNAEPWKKEKIFSRRKKKPWIKLIYYDFYIYYYTTTTTPIGASYVHHLYNLYQSPEKWGVRVGRPWVFLEDFLTMRLVNFSSCHITSASPITSPTALHLQQ